MLAAAHGVSVRFGARLVLDRVDVAVRAGRIVTVIGPNGSGKTTLARALLGLVTPAAGTLERAPGLKVAYVPQHLAIDATLPLSVERFLTLARGVAPAEIDGALRETGVAHLRRARMGALSGGETKRVLLARAILQRPEFLVLDEPAASVDLAGQGEFYALIKQLSVRTGCGVLLISHDLHIVMAAADEVVCLNGHVCCSGVPADVRQHPEFLALFGPRLDPALGVYTHHHDHTHGHAPSHGPSHG
jgi:zinc transport system ATP-binding protein